MQDTPEQIELLVDDMARRVATASLEAAQWRARAIAAETALAQMAEAAAGGGNTAADPEEAAGE